MFLNSGTRARSRMVESPSGDPRASHSDNADPSVPLDGEGNSPHECEISLLVTGSTLLLKPLSLIFALAIASEGRRAHVRGMFVSRRSRLLRRS